MALCRWNRYRTAVFWLAMTAIAPGGIEADPAGPSAQVVMAAEVDPKVSAGEPAPLILADAASAGQGDRQSLGPMAVAGEMARPPGEKDIRGASTGLRSAAIIRPLKDRKFALALVAGTPAPGRSSSLDARQPVFKNSRSNPLALSRNQTIQWVVLTDMMLAPKDGNHREAVSLGGDEAAGDEASWYYSMEMIFVPMTSLAVRAALSVDPGEEEFDTGELVPALENSRIGVSLGLDFRPKDGVVLDIDYARVMRGREAYGHSGGVATSDPQRTSGGASGDDVIRIRLSIQF